MARSKEISKGVLMSQDEEGSSFRLPNNSVNTENIVDEAVTTPKIADGAVTSEKLADGAISGEDIPDGSITTEKLADDAVTNPKMANASVGNAELVDGSVDNLKVADDAISETKIVDEAVTNAKLAANAVTTDKIADGAVGTNDLADGSVTNPKLATDAVATDNVQDSAIITSKINNNAVNSDKILDGAVLEAKLADGAVTTAKLADDAVDDTKIADDAVGNTTLQDDSVSTQKIQDEAVTNPKLGAGSVDNSKMAADAVATVNIQNSAVESAKLAELSVATGKLQDQSVTTPKIADANVTTAKLADDSVDNTKLAVDAVYTDAIQDGAVTADKIADGAIGGGGIADGSVTTEKLADGAVTTPKLAADAVDNSKLADDAVQTENVLNDAITNPKIAPNAIEADNIVDGSVGTAELADGSVTTPKIADANVTNPKLAADAVDNSKLADDAVQTENILDNAVTNPKIGSDAIDNSKIANDAVNTENLLNSAVTAPKLATDSVSSTKIQDGAVLTDKIFDNAITTPKISDDNVTNEKLAPNAVGTLEIQDDAVTEPKILNSAVTAPKIATDAVVTTKIQDDAVTNDKLAPDAVNTLEIQDLAVTNPKIADGAVSLTKLAPDSVDNSKIVDDAVTALKIKAGEVGTRELAPSSVTDVELADDSVSDMKIQDGAVTNPKLGLDAVTNANLADDAVQTENILNDAVTAPKLALDSVATTKIQDEAVTTTKLALDAVDNSRLAPDAVLEINIKAGEITNPLMAVDAIDTQNILDGKVTEAKIADLNITETKLADEAVTELKIGTDAVTNDKVAADAISEIELQDDSVSEMKLQTDSVSGAKIQDNAVDSPKINALAVTEGKIAADAVTTDKILDEAVTEPKLATDAVSTIKIQDQAVTGDKIEDQTITQDKLDPNIDLGGGGGGLEPVFIDETFTGPAENGKQYVINHNASFAIQLPASGEKLRIEFVDGEGDLTFAEAPVTIVPAAGDTINGYDEGIVLDVERTWLMAMIDVGFTDWKSKDAIVPTLGGVGGGGGGLTPVLIDETFSDVAVDGTLYMIDHSASFSIQLPPNAAGLKMGFMDVHGGTSFADAPVTLVPDGTDTVDGDNEGLEMDVAETWAEVNGTDTGDWKRRDAIVPSVIGSGSGVSGLTPVIIDETFTDVAEDRTLYMINHAAAFSIQLPNIADTSMIRFVDISLSTDFAENPVTLIPQAGETIDGADTGYVQDVAKTWNEVNGGDPTNWNIRDAITPTEVGSGGGGLTPVIIDETFTDEAQAQILYMIRHGASFSIQLPTLSQGVTIGFTNISGGDTFSATPVTLLPAPGETIEGADEYVLDVDNTGVEVNGGDATDWKIRDAIVPTSGNTTDASGNIDYMINGSAETSATHAVVVEGDGFMDSETTNPMIGSRSFKATVAPVVSTQPKFRHEMKTIDNAFLDKTKLKFTGMFTAQSDGWKVRAIDMADGSAVTGTEVDLTQDVHTTVSFGFVPATGVTYAIEVYGETAPADATCTYDKMMFGFTTSNVDGWPRTESSVFDPQFTGNQTLATNNWWYARDGEDMIMWGQVLVDSGAGAAQAIFVTIPENLNIDTEKLLQGSSYHGAVGFGGFLNQSSTPVWQGVGWYVATANQMNPIALAPENQAGLAWNELTDADGFSMSPTRIPILEWKGQSNRVALNNETLNANVAGHFFFATDQTGAVNDGGQTIIKHTDKTGDTNIEYSDADFAYVLKEAGFYTLESRFSLSAAGFSSNTYEMVLNPTDTSQTSGEVIDSVDVPTGVVRAEGWFEAGDLIRLRNFLQAAGNGSWQGGKFTTNFVAIKNQKFTSETTVVADIAKKDKAGFISSNERTDLSGLMIKGLVFEGKSTPNMGNGSWTDYTDGTLTLPEAGTYIIFFGGNLLGAMFSFPTDIRGQTRIVKQDETFIKGTGTIGLALADAATYNSEATSIAIYTAGDNANDLNIKLQAWIQADGGSIANLNGLDGRLWAVRVGD